MSDDTNDNHTSNVFLPQSINSKSEPHGRAALLLAESLIHGLIARGILTVEDALGIVGVASEVEVLIAEDGGNSSQAATQSATILAGIGTSLGHDVIPK